MSLFNDLQWEIIENPKATYSSVKIRREKKESEEENEQQLKQKRKELCAQKKQELPKDEYDKRRVKERYKRNKKRYGEKQLDNYYKRKAEDEAMIEQIYNEVYDTIPEPTNRDEYYTQKFRDDDTVKRGYRFAWRSSKLKNLNRSYIPKQKKPFRISNRRSMEYSMRLLHDIQCEVYEYLLPHMDEIKDCRISLYKKQKPYDFPLWHIDEPLKTLASWLDMNPARVVNVADAMIRWKLMVSELYLWRNSFIFWDVLVTQTGNTYRIALENNLPWLTKDTVEDIHKKRMEWQKNKLKDKPPIYIVNDAYLVKYEPNEREKIFYIIPT